MGLLDERHDVQPARLVSRSTTLPPTGPLSALVQRANGGRRLWDRGMRSTASVAEGLGIAGRDLRRPAAAQRGHLQCHDQRLHGGPTVADGPGIAGRDARRPAGATGLLQHNVPPTVPRSAPAQGPTVAEGFENRWSRATASSSSGPAVAEGQGIAG